VATYSGNMPAAERLRWIVFPSDPNIRQSSLTIGVRVRSFDSNRSSQEVERLSVLLAHSGVSPAIRRAPSINISPNHAQSSFGLQFGE